MENIQQLRDQIKALFSLLPDDEKKEILDLTRSIIAARTSSTVSEVV